MFDKETESCFLEKGNTWAAVIDHNHQSKLQNPKVRTQKIKHKKVMTENHPSSTTRKAVNSPQENFGEVLNKKIQKGCFFCPDSLPSTVWGVEQKRWNQRPLCALWSLLRLSYGRSMLRWSLRKLREFHDWNEEQGKELPMEIGNQYQELQVSFARGFVGITLVRSKHCFFTDVPFQCTRTHVSEIGTSLKQQTRMWPTKSKPKPFRPQTTRRLFDTFVYWTSAPKGLMITKK